MAKWSAVLVVMMMVTVMLVTVESDKATTDWINCFRSCSDSASCDDNDGDCFERCKIKCGGPNPPHGPGGPVNPPHSL